MTVELSWLEGTPLARLPAFATALAIGLLIGLERERHPAAKAGLRTFALVALFASLAGSLSEQLGTPWFLIAGLLLVGLLIIVAYARLEETADPGTTTVAALLVCYALSAMVWVGQSQLAVMLAIVTVALLYFKAELHGMTQRITRRDLISMLQFAVLSFIILPILPDRDFGPFDAFNPYEIWLLVVLIAGVSLAGYVALRVVGQRHSAPLLGLFGGLVSSTATTLVYARHARSHVDLVRLSVFVIVIANLVVLLRLGVLSAVVAPGVLVSLLPVLAAGLVVGALSLLIWRRREPVEGEPPIPELKNPTELSTALSFAAIYGIVVLGSAWLSEVAGTAGLYAVALVSGLTDVDAVSLSALRLFNRGDVSGPEATVAITLAICSNIAFKLGMVLVVAGPALFRRCAGAMGAVAAGLLLALVFLP